MKIIVQIMIAHICVTWAAQMHRLDCKATLTFDSSSLRFVY